MNAKALARCFLPIGVMVLSGRDLIKDHLRAVLLVRNPPRAADLWPVGMARLTVPDGADTWQFTVDLRYPVGAVGKIPSVRTFLHWLGNPTRAFAWRGAKPVRAGERRPLILYIPSWFAKRDESSFLLTRLASRGFVVAAFDDIVALPFRAGVDTEAQHSE